MAGLVYEMSLSFFADDCQLDNVRARGTIEWLNFLSDPFTENGREEEGEPVRLS